MPKFLILFVLFAFVSCDDGDFEIPSFEFTTTVNSCGDYVLHRINTSGTEAFIITLTDLDILQEETTSPIVVPISGENTQYRIFDSAVGSTYFCTALPATEPIVIKNWQGVTGASNVISIETNAVYDDNNDISGYEHTITMLNLVLESNGETLIFEEYLFGSFVTSL